MFHLTLQYFALLACSEIHGTVIEVEQSQGIYFPGNCRYFLIFAEVLQNKNVAPRKSWTIFLSHVTYFGLIYLTLVLNCNEYYIVYWYFFK